ncbi:hypothetical protein ARAM_007464 [Aspergillus rambellii]|uniref:WW domain-containing protein n=1 Tax=Aspergillus rambellii TaxID=308745 RepID=A0A0F8U820_9EURO|nr:hypothetical protein ARAM_007464 [Aspergillus rambellii]
MAATQQQCPPAPGNVPYPWVARWDERDQRWFFQNEQTGQTSREHPGYSQGAPPASQGQYYGGGGGGAPAPGGYYNEQQQQQHHHQHHQQQQEQERAPKKDRKMLYAAGGLAAGAIGGAMLMHKGEEIHDDFERDKYRFEDGVEDIPEDAARWTGEAVGGVEYGVDRVENKVEHAVDDVEDFPENAAEWVGDKVGDVERFGDNVDNAYDYGVEEGRDRW